LQQYAFAPHFNLPHFSPFWGAGTHCQLLQQPPDGINLHSSPSLQSTHGAMHFTAEQSILPSLRRKDEPFALALLAMMVLIRIETSFMTIAIYDVMVGFGCDENGRLHSNDCHFVLIVDACAGLSIKYSSVILAKLLNTVSNLPQ
jgi:hypothetical protein